LVRMLVRDVTHVGAGAGDGVGAVRCCQCSVKSHVHWWQW